MKGTLTLRVLQYTATYYYLIYYFMIDNTHSSDCKSETGTNSAPCKVTSQSLSQNVQEISQSQQDNIDANVPHR